MATTTFSGPIKAGTIRNTTGTTLGSNVANVGSVVMTQSSDTALTHATTTATALGIIIPANSQILNINIVVESLFTNSNTTTIAVGNATGTPTNLGAAHNVSATAVGPLKMLQASAGAWDNIGTSDIELFGIVVANSASAGKARIVVEYTQNNNLSAL
jgi:hypothetical protein|tara:strand:+ start:730 stop:1203 length:474 start_codon:yes stop_codon:yes gene_type:complete